MDLVNRDFIKRVTILGGEPLCEWNLQTVRHILSHIPDTKTKWLYTGYKWENLSIGQQMTAALADYVVDGPYVDNLKDMKLEFRGSSNQRIIDVKQTLNNGRVITT